MAFSLDRWSSPQKIASQVVPKTIVTQDPSTGLMLPLTNASQRPFGSVQATGATAGIAVAVYETPSYVKAIAAASLGAGAEVALASVGVASAVQNNVLATTTLLGPASAGASGVARWAVGLAQTAALGGEVFTVKLEPRQVSGLV